MRLLLTGAHGMLGQDLTPLLAAQHDVLATDRDTLDITNPAQIAAVITEFKPDLIINCAAYTNVDGAESDRATATLLNTTAVQFLAEAAAQSGTWLITISTDYVFDGSKTTGYEETDRPAPRTVYGQTKAAGETAALAANPHRTIIVRTAWLYGHHGKNFVDTMLTLANTKPELRVVNDQHGSPTSTRALARHLGQLVDELAAGQTPPSILHFTCTGHTTWYGLAQKAFELRGLRTPLHPCTTAEFPRPAPRPAYSILNNTRFAALPTWEEALAEYLN